MFREIFTIQKEEIWSFEGWRGYIASKESGHAPSWVTEESSDCSAYKIRTYLNSVMNKILVSFGHACYLTRLDEIMNKFFNFLRHFNIV